MRSGKLAALVATACLAVGGGTAAASGTELTGAVARHHPASTPTPSADPAAVATAARPPADDPVRVPPPQLSPFTYTFPVRGCPVSYARTLVVLPKTTIWAKRGCVFVAPVDGVIREVGTVNRWTPATDRGADREGRFVTVTGVDGVLYLGGHLDSIEPGLRPGTRVRAGQRLGRIGNSGNARDTASNLYFAMSWPVSPDAWWVRRGMIKPWSYLDAWDDGNRTLSPRAEMTTMRKRLGTVPACRLLCESKRGVVPRESQPAKRPSRKGDTRVVVPLSLTRP